MKHFKNKKGITLILLAFFLVLLLAFASLAIDIAYMYLAKNELQVAADAAALAGAGAGLSGIDNSTAALVQETARQAAWRFACRNRAAGSNVYLVTNEPADCNTPTPPDGATLNGSNNAEGDIIVGNWNETTRVFTLATGGTGLPVNALKVRARRTGADPVDDVSIGDNPVSLFLGNILGLIPGAQAWPVMSVRAEAIASQTPARNLAPISVNEYWMGDGSLGGGDCGDPTKPDFDRDPHGIQHVYANSFVRPPCLTWLLSDNTAGNICTSPSNPTNGYGNVDPFPTLSCDPSGQGGPTPVTVIANGPLTTPCAGAAACAGRPAGKPSAGRVFAIVGGNARANAASFEMFGLIDLDGRVGRSLPDGQWYQVSGSTFIPQSPNKAPNTQKSVVVGYLASGVYPNILPISVTEVFQTGYTAVLLYTSTEPYASTSFFPGAGAIGNDVKANFYDNANYSGGKYAPGKKIIVAVYDGIVGGGGIQARTTIVGFARITIFGYGNNLSLDASGLPVVSGPPETTMYGYVETIEDSLRQNINDLPVTEVGTVKLVK